MRALVVLAYCVLSGTLVAQAVKPQEPVSVAPLSAHVKLENAARVAILNGDRASVAELAEAVFNIPHRYRMDANLAGILRSRTIAAELGFRQGAHSGVEEPDIVSLINSFAQRFGLPEFAKTSPNQIRVLRMEALLYNPTFLGRGMAPGKIEVGQ